MIRTIGSRTSTSSRSFTATTALASHHRKHGKYQQRGLLGGPSNVSMRRTKTRTTYSDDDDDDDDNNRSIKTRGGNKSTDAIDWDKQNDRFKAERIYDECLEAIADGDEQKLEQCLLQINSEKKIKKISKKLEDATGDQFWKMKVKEIAATRVLDDCMSAILSGDASEIDGCIVEVENEVEYLEKNK
jgi:hypothetical protein